MQILEVEFATPAYDEIVRLRDQVLRKPLGLEFSVSDLSREYTDHHFGCYDKGYLIGCLNMRPLEEGVVKMRQVAVDPISQGKGVGSILVKAVEKWATNYGYEKIVLSARKEAISFYTKLDYTLAGEPYEEIGIPHHKMEKRLICPS